MAPTFSGCKAEANETQKCVCACVWLFEEKMALLLLKSSVHRHEEAGDLLFVLLDCSPN